MDGERVDSGARLFANCLRGAMPPQRDRGRRREKERKKREEEREKREMRISRHAGELPQSVNDFTLVSVTAFSRLYVPGSTQTFTKAPSPPLLSSSRSRPRV